MKALERAMCRIKRVTQYAVIQGSCISQKFCELEQAEGLMTLTLTTAVHLQILLVVPIIKAHKHLTDSISDWVI